MQLLLLGMQTGAVGLQQLSVLSTALQDTSVAAVEALLAQAVQQRGPAVVGVMQCLHGCPAVKELNKSSVLQLLRMGLQNSVGASAEQDSYPEDSELQGSMLGLLFSEQAGVLVQETLGPEGIAEAVKIALDFRRFSVAALLCELQAAKMIPAEEASQLLQLAAAAASSDADDRRIAGMVDCLQDLQQLQPLQLQELLAAAVQGSCSISVARLLQMPAAPSLSAAAVENLLHAAVEVRSVAAVELLCQMPAAGDITPAAAGSLLKAALASNKIDSCKVTHGKLIPCYTRVSALHQGSKHQSLLHAASLS
jgi:hypothetical protein